jgi:hypothetical protein
MNIAYITYSFGRYSCAENTKIKDAKLLEMRTKARGLSAKKLSQVREDASRKTFRGKFVTIYGLELQC